MIGDQSERLSSLIDQLLANLVIGLEYQEFTPPERATVLDSIDGLLRFKIDVKASKGVQCG